jgi:toxin-antitoxin system PIN domain toxin
MSATVDANVLLYASNTDAPEHARASEVVDRLLAGPALTTLLWPVLMSYLRIVTHPRIFARPLTPAVATGVIDELLVAPTVQVVGENAGSWTAYHSLDLGRPIAGNDVPEATIVALMLANGVSAIYTRDRGFRRFDGIQVIDPFA